MEVSLNKTDFRCYHKTFTQRFKKEETQDTVVPDTMPDIGEVLETTGILMIRSKDVDEGVVKVSGTVSACVVYKAEDRREICSLEVSIPVSLNAESEHIRDEAAGTAELQLLSVETRVLNPRKVLVKAEISAQIDCYVSGVREFPQDIGPSEADIHVLRRTVPFSPTVSVREKTFVVTDEWNVPPSSGAAKEILSRRVSTMVDDIKTVGSKLIFKGYIKCALLYNTTDDLLATAEFSSNFSQIIECDTAFNAPAASVDVLPTGVYFEILSGGEGRTISMELHMLAQSLCSERTELQYLADAYSNTHSLNLEQQEETVDCLCQQPVLKENVRQLYETPVPAVEVIEAHAAAGVAVQQEGRIELPVCLYVLYRGGDGQTYSGKKRCTVDFPLAQEMGGSVRVCGCDLTELIAIPSDGGVELRLHVQLQTMLLTSQTIRTVASMSYQEDESVDLSGKPSLVILRASDRDDLWTIAKENCSSVEQIEEINGLRDCTGEWEKFLLIPRVR